LHGNPFCLFAVEGFLGHGLRRSVALALYSFFSDLSTYHIGRRRCLHLVAGPARTRPRYRSHSRDDEPF
jgi:hypothetical protein